MAIINVKTWSKNGERRVYVNFDASRKFASGVIYLTGNRHQPAGSTEGLTADDLAAAKALAFDGRAWRSAYADAAPVRDDPFGPDHLPLSRSR